MMRRDVATVRLTTTIAACRKLFRLGSHQALFLIDDKGSYRGVVLLPDVFSSEVDNDCDSTEIVALARYAETVLTGSLNVVSAMKCFEEAEADVLAVVDRNAENSVVGFLNEAYARRRYIEELNHATGGVATQVS